MSTACACVFEDPHLVAAVLARVESIKAKARLASTCRLFARVLRGPAAWQLTTALCFSDHIDSETTINAGGCLVNDESVQYVDLPQVLEYLLCRIRLRQLRLAHSNADLVYEMVLSRICSASLLPTIEFLSVSGRGKDTYVLPFIWAFQSTLKVLHVGNCVFSARVRVVQFWKAIAGCTKLTELRHLSYRSHVDTHSLEEDVVGALRGKHIHTLYLLALRNLSPNGITDLLTSIPSGCLRRLSLSHANVSLRMIRDQVDDVHRHSLREFRFGPFPADGTDDQLAVTIPLIFPNLVRCTLEAQALTFPSSTVVETIDRFLTHLEADGCSASSSVSEGPSQLDEAADSSSSRWQRHSNEHKAVVLCMSIYFQHIEVLEKVLGRMVREKGCAVAPVRYAANRYKYVITRNDATVTFYDFEPPENE